ncbi:LPS export ABC transporter permease LptF [Pseudooctadecabacter jejudonensis]|uniref:Putative permease YjgP/YjgQ family protein n=1 Tax=Pseudooctadecabacter jejudonensis TaxID=1391910 RepID=A0A1Y5RMP8_9RHOB|nr:LPS export ABC transporter permease LptF [Pseudooctadecabacter jejudonensis]SLN18542.1 putative permease YjgP/YjgQ family protein [Pseudooctadecabacter jejudonensis]
MARFDRYMLSQLLILFGFFSLILVLIYWINRAVRLFDQLIADGQSAWVFLELTSLSLPSIIRIVLPLSAFVAAVYVTNRMSQESELTVVQATGYSPARLARPVIYFGAIVALLLSALVHVLVPLSTTQLSERQEEISQNLTARLLTPGQFLTPSDGVTFYIRDISSNGEMLDIFISEATDPARRVTYTASRAYLIRTDNGPQLVMVDGLSQTYDVATNRLATTGFEDFAYDVSTLMSEDNARARSASGLWTWELLNPTPAILEETGAEADALRLRGHDRFAQTALGFVAGLVGFSALVAGGFSRFGLWRSIMFAVGLVVVLKILESTGASIARGNPQTLWPFVYLAGVGGIAISGLLLHIAARPYFFKRKPRGITP